MALMDKPIIKGVVFFANASELDPSGDEDGNQQQLQLNGRNKDLMNYDGLQKETGNFNSVDKPTDDLPYDEVKNGPQEDYRRETPGAVDSTKEINFSQYDDKLIYSNNSRASITDNHNTNELGSQPKPSVVSSDETFGHKTPSLST